MSIVKEFKEFAMRGNVLDMAVGVVIGGAFGKIISSLVADVMMPLISIITGGVNFTHWKLMLKKAVMDGDKIISPEVSVNYGMFIQVTFDFVIIAFCIFVVIKAINKLKKKESETPAVQAPPSDDIVLLTEIRDLLKKNADDSQ